MALKTIIVALMLTLTGCANTHYTEYAKAMEASNVARSKALADIAGGSDGSAKVAAVMALVMGNNGNIQAPPQNELLQWASILVPSITNIAGMRYNYLSTVAQSNNSASVAMSTNSTMLGIAGKIQAPGTITTTNNTMSGTGVLGSGTYNTYDNHTANSTPVVNQPVVVVPPVVTNEIVQVGP